METYFRPLVQIDPARPQAALSLAGGWAWFTHAEMLTRSDAPQVVPLADIPKPILDRLTAPRGVVAGLSLDRPRVMGIVNVTPDSFSDGGRHAARDDAIAGGLAMQRAGVDLVDIGGESTRPGAMPVEPDEEINRVVPVIAGLRAAGMTAPVSVDTRKTTVAAAAHKAGADLVNDVSGFTFDAGLAPYCAAHDLPVCVMHSQGEPETMQQNPQYDDVVLDVYDVLERQVAGLIAQGIPRDRIIADPGIGFGKTLAHNLALLARISLFHALGVPILLGASRKRFVGTIGKAGDGAERAPGSVAVALAALASGVQMVRVHDVAETVQAVALWRAATSGRYSD